MRGRWRHGVGYCAECEKKVQNASICPTCDGLCVNAKQHDEELARDRQRARPLMEDIPTIIGYPMRDPLAFVMLALFTWFLMPSLLRLGEARHVARSAAAQIDTPAVAAK